VKVVEITVTAGRTFNHPHEQYSNLRPEVTLRATLEAEDDHAVCVKILQADAEDLVEQHKDRLLGMLEDAERNRIAAQRLDMAERQLKQARERVELLERSIAAGQMVLPPTPVDLHADDDELESF